MLQQTQVITVIPYFKRFITQFPDIPSLALAPIDTILALWTGLGYYSRARNLHATAMIIHQNYKDNFPNTLEALCALPGIGRSTAGAILALGFQKRYPILDGNVKRVLCRYFALDGWPGLPKVAEQLWAHSDRLTPSHRVHDYTQAMMDLGATVCKRSKPNCSVCPLQTDCKAYANNTVSDYPSPKPRKIKPLKAITLMIVRCETSTHQVLLEQRPSSGIWGGLWSFPEYSGEVSDVALNLWVKEHFNQKVKKITNIKSFKHSFTHFDLTIHPVELVLQHLPHHRGNQYWHRLDKRLDRGVSAPIKRLLESLKNKLDTGIENKVK